MIRAIVCGAAGRMGGRIVALALGDEGYTLAGAVERPGHPAVGRDAGEAVGAGVAGVSIVDQLDPVIRNGDVIFDFTTPAAALKNLEAAAVAGVSAVIGTTGFSAEEIGRARDLSRAIPCVLAPNMSVGVNLLLTILPRVARVLADEYDIEITEAHHRMKKDAPSGTALALARAIAGAVGRDLEAVAVYGREGLVGERTPKEIGIQAVRAGDIIGDHTVIFGGLGERIEVTHRVHSRDTFARGALRAGRWVVGRAPGLYDMIDVLGLKE
ncbi:MAG: 4-hydroxy-tetrahydrodipicolinate reductase [Candidatus Methylomirabilales bacterium]